MQRTLDTPQPPVTPQELFARLGRLGISYKVWHHAPIFTVEEGAPLKASIPGLHCRNLFLRDKKEAMFLITAANETDIDLKKLPKSLGCGRLSFGSPDRLWRYLGVRPGSVCPFAVINDLEGAVTLILDKTMMAAEAICVHPLDNGMTVGLAPADLVKFVKSCGHKPHIMELKG